MLHDLEAGSPLEIEALMGAILEIGKLTNTPTPIIEAVYALVKMLDKLRRRPGNGRTATVIKKATTSL